MVMFNRALALFAIWTTAVLIWKHKQEEKAVIEANVKLAAVNNELEAFAYSVSHDLRAPLRSADGFSKALLEDYSDKLGDMGKDYIFRIRSACQRMGNLIDDLLTLSRVTRSRMERKEVDISALSREVAEDIRSRNAGRDVEFIIQDGLRAHCDEGMLRVVLENLMGNAWKFTGFRGRAVIELGIMNTNGVPAFFVRDNGAGFDMAYANKLFGAFQRLHGAREFEGTGIGLATVQRIINKHGGHVWGEGKIDEGATFYFTINQRRGNRACYI